MNRICWDFFLLIYIQFHALKNKTSSAPGKVKGEMSTVTVCLLLEETSLTLQPCCLRIEIKMLLRNLSDFS